MTRKLRKSHSPELELSKCQWPRPEAGLRVWQASQGRDVGHYSDTWIVDCTRLKLRWAGVDAVEFGRDEMKRSEEHGRTEIWPTA